ncbi:MAG TPA: SRPBCC family protein, partial [Pseudonocardiaceae bacterium]
PAGVAHARVTAVMPVPCERAFDLLHDYGRRLEWDTLLRAARLDGAEHAGVGAVAVCTARRLLGGYSFRTRYVTFRRPTLAAVTLVRPAPFFARWSASARHRPRPDGTSELIYTMTFTCRPQWARRLVEPLALAAFRLETGRRLRALAAFLATERD